MIDYTADRNHYWPVIRGHIMKLKQPCPPPQGGGQGWQALAVLCLIFSSLALLRLFSSSSSFYSIFPCSTQYRLLKAITQALYFCNIGIRRSKKFAAYLQDESFSPRDAKSNSPVSSALRCTSSPCSSSHSSEHRLSHRQIKSWLLNWVISSKKGKEVRPELVSETMLAGFPLSYSSPPAPTCLNLNSTLRHTQQISRS